MTVTATNTNTGVARTTVTNGEGVYYMPGLEPGVYDVKTDLHRLRPGGPRARDAGVNATLTLDFKLALAGVEETLTVTGEAPLIETTQSKFASSIETTELAESADDHAQRQRDAGAAARRVADDADRFDQAERRERVLRRELGHERERRPSTARTTATTARARRLMSFTLESLEQFQLATSQFSAADGSTGGVAVTMVTKSGTNVFHGSGFVYARDKALTAKDYFTERDDRDEVPFNRQQWGGSLGGPLLRNRMFFFGAFEFVNQDTSVPVPDRQFNELELLVAATRPPGRCRPGWSTRTIRASGRRRRTSPCTR